ncbi:MAG: pyridoxamine 5'-phosphate oxidase family protein, partial [Nocardiopsaceae bacterium]|nr:pyridoxamine 5'-phosphate oxidase family protein [Nocardiopsaceae bacterium]
MSDSSRNLGDVTRAEALLLLAGVPLGRIVFTENAMPAVRPASHLVEGGDIIARSHDGSAIVPAGEVDPGPGRSGSGERETVVAYQADEIDTGSRLGWSVVVTGPARPVLDPDE